MVVGQQGIVFFNGEKRFGEIQHVGEENVVIEFYGRGHSGSPTYQVSHSKDSIMIINSSVRKGTICGFRSADMDSIRRRVGCIVEDFHTNAVTGLRECSIISIKRVGDRLEFFRENVLPKTLAPLTPESAISAVERYLSGGIRCPENLKSKILHRECSKCGEPVSAVRDSGQYISGARNNIPSEDCICGVCARLESNKFECEVCSTQKPVWENAGFFHSSRTANIIDVYKNICNTCSHTITICENCGIVAQKNVVLDGRVLCPVCSEESIKLIYRHPSRTVYPENHFESTEFSKINSKRHAGVEIECIHDWRHLDVPRGWRIVSDTSISDEENGAEYVMTYPANGDFLLNRVDNITKFINNTGGFVDSSCGLHIHINGLDMQLEEMKRCLAIGKSMETWIYDMLPPDRKTSRYSKPLPNFDVKKLMNISTYSEFVEFWYNKISNADITTEKYNESRYRGFNVHSRFINGTIEFRHHHGTLNFTSIEKWIKLCMAVVDTSFRMNKDSKEILIDNPLEYSASDFFYALGFSEFNNHYNKMKEKVKTIKPKESPAVHPDFMPYLEEMELTILERHNLGMVEERDSDLERM
jgi:hypothetical protein